MIISFFSLGIFGDSDFGSLTPRCGILHVCEGRWWLFWKLVFSFLLKYFKGLVTPSFPSHWNNYYSYICVFNTRKWDDIQLQVANNERLPKFGHVKGRWESPFRLIFWLEIQVGENLPKLIGAYWKPWKSSLSENLRVMTHDHSYIANRSSRWKTTCKPKCRFRDFCYKT